MASVWEIAMKHKIKPQHMPMSEEEFVTLCESTGFIELPIKAEHIFLLKTLVRPMDAPKHNDPSDRILLAQANYESLKLITHNLQLPYYEGSCIISV